MSITSIRWEGIRWKEPPNTYLDDGGIVLVHKLTIRDWRTESIASSRKNLVLGLDYVAQFIGANAGNCQGESDRQNAGAGWHDGARDGQSAHCDRIACLLPIFQGMIDQVTISRNISKYIDMGIIMAAVMLF